MKASAMALAAIGFTAVSIAGSSAGDNAGIPDGFKPTGESKACLQFRTIRTIKAIDETHFLVRVGHKDYYISHTADRCASATKRTNRIQITTPSSQLCSAESIDVVNRFTGVAQSSCILGKFERLERASS